MKKMTEIPKEIAPKLRDSGDHAIHNIAREGWPVGDVGQVSDRSPVAGSLQFADVMGRVQDLAVRLAALNGESVSSFLRENDGSYYKDPYAQLAQAALIDSMRSNPAVMERLSTST